MSMLSKMRKPSSRKVGLKVLVSGETGSGKSVFSLSFPNVLSVDSEAGIAGYEGGEIGKNLVGVINTQSHVDLEKIIKEVKRNHEKEGIKTLVIDSETKIYQNIQEACMKVEEDRALRNAKDLMDTALSVRSWGKIKEVSSRLQNRKIDLSSEGVHMVSIVQVEDLKEKKGDDWQVVGKKISAAKNIEYDYDIHIRLTSELNDLGEMDYRGTILKDRTGITRVGETIANPSYELWKVLESKGGQVFGTDLADAVELDVKHSLNEEKSNDSKAMEIEKNKLIESLRDKILADVKVKEALQVNLTKYKVTKVCDLPMDVLETLCDMK